MAYVVDGLQSPQSTQNKLESKKVVNRVRSWHQLEHPHYPLKRSNISSVSIPGFRPSTNGEWKANPIPLANQPFGFGQYMTH